MVEVNLSKNLSVNSLETGREFPAQGDGFNWLPPAVFLNFVVLLSLFYLHLMIEEESGNEFLKAVTRISVLVQTGLLGVLIFQGGGFL